MRFPKSFLKGFLLFILLIVVRLGVIAGCITIGPLPVWVTGVKPDINAQIPASQVEDGYYYLLSDKQENVATRTSFFHLAKKIVNQSGVENSSQLKFYYDKAFNNIVIHQVNIIRSGKVINKLSISKLKIVQQVDKMEELQYDETMTGMLFIEDVQVDDVIEYSYSFTTNNPLFKKYTDNFDLQFSSPIAQIYYRVLMPVSRKLEVKCLNNALQPSEKITNGIHEYTWQLKNLPALKLDDGTPSGFDPYSQVELSEYSSWKEVKQWAVDIYAPAMVSDAKVRQQTAIIEKNYSNGSDRIIAALRFVQDQVRYLGIETGINTHQPHHPGQVLKQGYGDCKDKTVLFCCLLKEMGITAHPVLINAGAPLLMPQWLPSSSHFNHVCARVDYLDNQYYFDPTINYQRGSLQTTYFPNYRYGLVIGDPADELTKLPFSDVNTSTTLLNRFTIHDTLSPAEYEVITDYTGRDADEMREKFAVNSLQGLQKSYLDFYTQIYKDISITDSVKVLTDDSLNNKITTREAYTISHLWKKRESGEWHVGLYADNFKGLLNKPKGRKRTMPIRITYPQNYTEKYELKLPEDWNAKTEQMEVENNAIHFTYSGLYQPSDYYSIHLTYSLHSKKAMTDTAENAAYYKDVDQIIDSLGYGLTYKPGISDKVSTSSSVSFFMVFIFLFASAIAFYIARRIYLEYDITTPYTGHKPLDISGWLIIPMIGVILSPFIFMGQIIKTGFFKGYVTNIIFNPAASNYNPALGGVLIGELVANAGLIILSILCLVLFFQKRSVFPRIYIAKLLINAGISLLDELVVNTNLIKTASDTDYTGLARLFLQCIIWIPYMLKSERVQKTFTLWHSSRPLPVIPEVEPADDEKTEPGFEPESSPETESTLASEKQGE